MRCASTVRTRRAATCATFILGQRRWAGVNGIYDYSGGNQRGLGASQLVIDRWDAAKNAFVLVSKPGGGL